MTGAPVTFFARQKFYFVFTLIPYQNLHLAVTLLLRRAEEQMKTIWKFVDKLNIGNQTKNAVYIILMFFIGLIIGGILWAALGRLFLPEISWLICFIGYPGVFFGILGGALYLFEHEFS